MGMPKAHITVVDRQGVIHDARGPLPPYKAEFANTTEARTLADALAGADVFIGVSGANPPQRRSSGFHGAAPGDLCLANPDPEIRPEAARAVRDDVIVATGRSDFPNQVNNVLCFPFIFRGALDVRATDINEAMKIAAVEAIAALAREPVPVEVLGAYEGVASLSFGPEYILPKPMDPRLRDAVANAVAEAAVTSGVATRHLASLLENLLRARRL